jgi:hypothetical protein
MEGSLVAYKVFSNGSVLNASEINDNLMNQSVMVFSNSTARAAALTAPVEGMLTWLEDVNRYESYDGSAWTSPFGLTLLNSTSFSGVTSQSVNNVFTSAYHNYRIMINITNVATDGLLTMKMRAAGVDVSTGYYTSVMGILENGTAANMTGAGISSWSINDIDGSIPTNASTSTVIELFNPQRTNNTSGTLVANGQNQPGFLRGFAGGLWLPNSTSFDGFTIAQAGNIAGTIRVYGYKN